MTLEELKAAWDAAKAKAEAAPEDVALKAAAEAAEQAYNEAKEKAEGEEDDDGIDDSKLDEKTKSYVEKLRKENAKHRVKGKDLASKLKLSETQRKAILKAAGIEDDSDTPEEKVKSLTAESQTLSFRNAVLELAVEQGIPKEQLKFFQFLVAEAVGELEEGDELSEETLADIVKQAQGGTGKAAKSSVGGGGKSPKPGETSEIDLAKFLAMGINERSLLYGKNPEAYLKLTEEAKAKGKKLV